MAKNKLWNVDFFWFMHLNWNAFAIIIHTDIPFALIDLELQHVHFFVSLVVIRSIYEHLIKYFVKCWYISDLLICEFQETFPENPFRWFFHLDAANVGIWP